MSTYSSLVYKVWQNVIDWNKKFGVHSYKFLYSCRYNKMYLFSWVNGYSCVEFSYKMKNSKIYNIFDLPMFDWTFTIKKSWHGTVRSGIFVIALKQLKYILIWLSFFFTLENIKSTYISIWWRLNVYFDLKYSTTLCGYADDIHYIALIVICKTR